MPTGPDEDRRRLARLARRVRPPGPFKDWTEAHQGGVDLPPLVADILAGIDRPRRCSPGMS